MIHIKRFRHTAIVVNDIEKMVNFYTNTFGMIVKRRTELDSPEFKKGVGIQEAKARGAHLTFPNTDFELELIQFMTNIQNHDKGQSNQIGYRHIAFIVDNLDEVYEKLKKENIEFISDQPICMKQPASIAGFRFIYMKDPEGNIIELNQLPADTM